MTKRTVVNHAGFIRKFKSAGNIQRKQYLMSASPREIGSLLECTLNVCNGNIPLTSRQLNSLKKHKKVIKQLSFGKSKFQNKKRLLVQKGGFLPLIASAALSFLGPIIANAVGL
jgi:hypothetical protein